MEIISNEHKAKEIANAFFIVNVSKENEQVIREMLNKAALEAMAWKDEQLDEQWKRLMAESKSIGVDILRCKEEQIAKEKQQWIDKAAVYISTHTLTTMSIVDIHNMIIDFKQAMKGEY